MEDENNGKIMSEFVGLRAKLYAFQIYKSEEDQTQAYESDEEIKDDTVKMRAKGVKKSTLRTITFDDYKQCLFDNIKVTKDEYVIKSRNHEVNTLLQKKLALSWEDDKRQLLVNSTDTLLWGYEIP
ncbi:GSCOCG00012384001-RA-CDS, partial [Cotesia congregata]